MPIADVLKHREAFAYAGLQAYQRKVSKAYDPFDAVTVGLFDRVEIGVDNDFRGTWCGNAKLQIFERDRAALSVGATGWRGEAMDPFVVGRFDSQGFRLHGGLWRTGGAGRAMLGADFPAGREFTGSVEFLSGPGGQVWAALFYAVPQVPGLGVQAALGASSDRAVGVQHAACLFYAFKV